MASTISESEEISVAPVLGSSSRRHRSKAWQHFEHMVEEDKAVCIHCRGRLTASGGTGHLLRHIKNACTGITDDAIRKQLVTEMVKDGPFAFDPVRARQYIAKYVVSAGIPFLAIEDHYFHKLMRSMQPTFKVPGRQSIHNDCAESLFEHKKSKLRLVLQEVDSKMSFTSDLWTSNQKLGYLTLTCHYISKDFVLHKKVLSFKQIPHPHKANTIARVISSCLSEWGLVCKVFALTLDNCSTNDKAIQKLRETLGNNMLFNGEHLHVRCCSHILNILVKEGVKILDIAVEKIRELVKSIYSSGARLQKFNELAEKMRFNTKRGLTLDVPTRWNSTYVMLSEALQYKDVYSAYQMKYCDKGLSMEDWEKATTLCEFLEVFYDATKSFSAEKYPCAHMYIREVWAVRETLLSEGIQLDDLLRGISIQMQTKYHKYWNEPNMVLALAFVLDPRSKLVFLDFCYSQAYGEDAKDNLEKVKSCLGKFYSEYAKQEQVSGSSRASHNVDNHNLSTSSSPRLGKRKLESDFAQYRSQNRVIWQKKSELDSYLDEDVVSDESDIFDILGWWKANRETYPTLARMARDILAVQVSSVPSESTFSRAKWIINQYRSNLGPETIEALICTKDWIKKSSYSSSH